MSICILFSAQYRLSSRGSHFCHGVYTFAKKYRVSSRGFHLPEYHGTKPCFPLTPPVIKFSIHICFLRKNTSPFFPKVPEKPGKSTFLDEKSDCLNMARVDRKYVNYLSLFIETYPLPLFIICLFVEIYLYLIILMTSSSFFL